MIEPPPAAAPKEASEPRTRTFASQAGTEQVAGHKPLNGYVITLMHIVKCYVGTGIFAMGEGYKNSGLIMGTVLLVIIALMNLDCQHMLINACVKVESEEEEEVKASFSETVEYTLESSRIEWVKSNSKAMGWSITVFLCLCELGYSSVYFVFIANHLLEIADAHDVLDQKHWASIHIVLAVILAPMWASTFLGNLKLLFPLSMTANVLMWIGILLALVFATKDGLPPVSERALVAEAQRWPLYYGTVLFAIGGITFLMPIRNEMRNPKLFTSLHGVLNVGMVFVGVLYFFIGFLGYWQWGEDVKSSVFLNIKTGNAEWIADFINSIMSVGVLFTFTIHMYIPFEITFPLFYRKYGPFKYGKLVMGVYRSVPVLICYTLANVIPFLGLFISLIGATGGSFLALMIPPVLELVAFHGQHSHLTIVKDVVIIFAGILGTISGTVLTVMEIVEKFRTTYG